jgi:serine/threonine protein kinase
MTNNIRALSLGQMLSDYRIDEILGQGGFGITYLATDMMLDRRVAIKEYYPREFAVRDSTLTVHAAGNQEDRDTFKWGLERFIEEARLLARLNHPNIIAVRRFFEANGTAYFVMDYCEGEPLDELIKRNGPLNSEQVSKIIHPVLDGLEHLHKVNFLHRDIKPANLYIKSDGTPVLLDFGAARQEIVSHSRSVTSLATPGYAAFEQYSTKGRQGPWTDVYGFAATMYRAVTGEKPQDSPDRVLEDSLEPASVLAKGKFSPALLKAIDYGMSVRPENRPQSIEEWRKSFLDPERMIDVKVKTVQADSKIEPVKDVKKLNPEPSIQQSSRDEKLIQKPNKSGSASTVVMVGIFILAVGIIGYFSLGNKAVEKIDVVAKVDTPKPVEVPSDPASKAVESVVAITQPTSCVGPTPSPSWSNCIGAQVFGAGTLRAGQKYNGEFSNGVWSGQGVLIFQDGAKYTGSFKNGVRSGKGSMVWVGGDRYVGSFRDDQMDGSGTYTFGSGQYAGKKYVGDFKDGLRNGKGTLYDSSGVVIATGIWENGSLAANNLSDQTALLAQCKAKSAEANASLPKAVDGVTNWISSTCTSQGTSVVYTMVYQLTADAKLSQEQLKTALYEKLKATNCSNPKSKEYLKQVDFEYKYLAKDGGLMGVLRYPKNSCQ